MNVELPHPAEPKLLAFLDGDLSPSEAAAVHEHCASCAGCSRLLEELDAVRRILGTLEPAEPLRPVWSAVRERRSAVRAPMARPRFVAAAAAMGAAGVVLGLVLGTAVRRPAATNGTYLWSHISSISEDEGSALPDLYWSPDPSEGR